MQQHGEVEDPEQIATRSANLIRSLADHPQSHVLQHRQHIGEVNGLGAMEQLEPYPTIILLLLRAVEQHAQRLGFAQVIKRHDVGHGRASSTSSL